MAGRVYIYSTLTSDVDYAIYTQTEDKDFSHISRRIRVHGGANVATKQLITPRGKVTEVSEEDFELLQKDYVFNLHVKNGFITHDSRKKDVDETVEKRGMVKKDRSAPKTKDDFKNDSKEDFSGVQVVDKK